MERSRRSKVSAKKNARQAALKAMRNARDGTSALDTLDMDQDDNVYDLVDEESYNKLVAQRREREDFVVDDEGLGYYDDGEEQFYHNEEQEKQQLEQNTKQEHGALSDAAKRRARKLNQLTSAASKVGKVSDMWSFVKKDTSVGLVREQDEPLPKKENIFDEKPILGNQSFDLDSMLNDLESDVLKKPKKSSMKRKREEKKVLTKGKRLKGASLTKMIYGETQENIENISYNDNDNFQDNYDDDDHDDIVINNSDLYDNNKDEQKTNKDEMIIEEKKEEPKGSKSRFSKVKEETRKSSIEVKPSTINSSLPSLTSRDNQPLFGDLDMGNEQQQQHQQQQQNINNINAQEILESDYIQVCDGLPFYFLDAYEKNGVIYLFGKIPIPEKNNNTNTQTDTKNNKNSAFSSSTTINKKINKPQQYASCCVTVNSINRHLYVLPRLLKPSEKREIEREMEEKRKNGEDVPAEIPHRMDIKHVYEEISNTLYNTVIPKRDGESFRSRPVKKKYAFDEQGVPREEEMYLEVVYSAKRPKIPDPYLTGEDAEVPGMAETYSHIFNARASPLETFLLEKKIMGPSWLLLKLGNGLKPSTRMISWCKYEFTVDHPRYLIKMEDERMRKTRIENEEREKNEKEGITQMNKILKSSYLPNEPPKMIGMAMSLKTINNPKTHKHEIVAVSVMIHRCVNIDGPTEQNQRLENGVPMISQYHFLRQLGTSAGKDYPMRFPHNLNQEIKKKMRNQNILLLPKESILLSRLNDLIYQQDPDIIWSHNMHSFDRELLIHRAIDSKLKWWSRFGRIKRGFPSGRDGFREVLHRVPGRIWIDTEQSAKELVRKTTYSLTFLAKDLFNVKRIDLEPKDIPKYFSQSDMLIELLNHTCVDAQIINRLCFHLQVIPLTKQLTNLSGNLWNRTTKGQRAERIEYLLLHEFYNQGFLLPEKKHAWERAKDNDSSYKGGMVLDPRKGLYDKMILLLDFNSLYPSIIQEYNICFTTIDWGRYLKRNQHHNKDDEKKNENETDENDEFGELFEEKNNDNSDDNTTSFIPPPPSRDIKTGILPKVIRNLVVRRKQVKNLLKAEEKRVQRAQKESEENGGPKPSLVKRSQLDIRQKALKLTANSMYGCLGFSYSRFYAKPLAALVTAKGREALTETKSMAEDMGCDVIYGDTDSIMINTNSTDYKAVIQRGHEIKDKINERWRDLKVDIDGVFRKMLLLKKKKYAALAMIDEERWKKEYKGLDLVRRDWCMLSKDAGNYALENILSDESSEDTINNIHEYLNELGKKIKENEITIDKFIITKSLTKDVKKYANAKGQPHVQVAMTMQKAGQHVSSGTFIPYIICEQLNSNHTQNLTNEDDSKKMSTKSSSYADRAFHPLEYARRKNELTIDTKWYLEQQVLPPLIRLLEPIEGTSPSLLAEQLGLEGSKYNKNATGYRGYDEDDTWGNAPTRYMDDTELFKHCHKFLIKCSSCREKVEFEGCILKNDLSDDDEIDDQEETKRNKQRDNKISIRTGLYCSNCKTKHFGSSSPASLLSKLSNLIDIHMRSVLSEYYRGWYRNDDPSNPIRTRQITGNGYVQGDEKYGRLRQEFSEKQLYLEIKYLESLFNMERICNKLGGSQMKEMNKIQLDIIPQADKLINQEIYKQVGTYLESNAYNWITPSLWSNIFGKKRMMPKLK